MTCNRKLSRWKMFLNSPGILCSKIFYLFSKNLTIITLTTWFAALIMESHKQESV